MADLASSASTLDRRQPLIQQNTVMSSQRTHHENLDDNMTEEGNGGRAVD